MLKDEGIRLGNESTDFVSSKEAIRPLRDHIVVRPLDWTATKPGSPIIAIRRGAPVRGEVIAVGPGRYEKRYKRDEKDGQKSRSYTLKRTYINTEIKVGDIVELGGLEIGGYMFPRIRWGDQDVIICQEQDVCGVRL